VASYLEIEEDGTTRVTMEEYAEDIELEESVQDNVIGRFDPHLNPEAIF
jgi:uncharacterized protein YuzE